MNRYIATGRLVSDPELRALPDGTPVCDVRIAVKGLKRGNEVGYIDVASFGAGGKAAYNVLAKGWLVSVDGRLEYHDWETEGGEKRQGWAVVGPIEFLAAPRGNGAEADAEQDAQPEQPAAAKSTAEGERAAA
jgi:single-strand DNA-binding protein